LKRLKDSKKLIHSKVHSKSVVERFVMIATNVLPGGWPVLMCLGYSEGSWRQELEEENFYSSWKLSLLL
jgi:hypothetical protein